MDKDQRRGRRALGAAVAVLWAWLALAPGSAAQSPNLIAHWPFDDGHNPTEDIAGAHDATLFGATFTGDTPFLSGNVLALRLDGPTNGNAVADNPAAFDVLPGSAITFALWLKRTSNRGVYHVFGKRDGCLGLTDMHYQFARDNLLVKFDSWNTPADGNSLTGLPEFPLDTWIHVAITYDGVGRLAIYYNGALMGEHTSFVFADPAADGLRFGQSGTCSTGQFFPGIIDDFRVYARALSQDEILCVAGADGHRDLNFEVDDEGAPLVHGQHLADGDPEFDGGSLFPLILSSRVNNSNLDTAAILDSDSGPAVQDPDLLVGRGKILVLQTDANTAECPSGSGVYCTHNDDEDGGTLSFAFPGPTTPSSVVLIDIDSTDGTSTVVLTDGAGAQRTYTVPANWTGDFMSDGPPGWKLLDLTDTNGQIGFGSTATAVEDAGFDPTGVLQIDIHLANSGGVDDLSWCETSVAVQPSVQPRNGSGVNHVILSSPSLPLIGGTWAANLDCQGFGSGLATLTVCRRATSGTMTPFGEQLIAGALFLRSGQFFAGSVSQFTWAIPNDSALVGLDLYAQGLCWSTQVPLGPKTMRARKGLSNALDLILGF